MGGDNRVYVDKTAVGLLEAVRGAVMRIPSRGFGRNVDLLFLRIIWLEGRA
jgi:hypothetical protein